MASRESAYEQFGRAAHTAQMLEWNIGNALLALDALITKSFLKPDADAYLRLREAIDKQTLGQSLKQMREKLPLVGDLDSLFIAALQTRNRLAHHFFPNHNAAWLDDAGRDTMVADLRDIDHELRRASAVAQNISSALVADLQAHGNDGPAATLPAAASEVTA